MEKARINYKKGEDKKRERQGQIMGMTGKISPIIYCYFSCYLSLHFPFFIPAFPTIYPCLCQFLFLIFPLLILVLPTIYHYITHYLSSPFPLHINAVQLFILAFAIVYHWVFYHYLSLPYPKAKTNNGEGKDK